MRTWPGLIIIAIGVAAFVAIVVLRKGPLEPAATPANSLTAAGRRDDPSYAGRQACMACHAEQYDRWAGSQHDLAMDVATERTVLGDFDGAKITHDGVTSTFSRRGDKFIVTTEGPDGRMRDYEVAYTFGVTPLQQYLVQFPGGRYQVLPLAWDTRPASEGGRRWFHMYPGEHIPHDDPLHWTGPSQNWNSMCAACHSTALVRGFDLETNTYHTTWTEIDVSCEACHGPGAEHVAWARAPQEAGGAPGEGDMGLTVSLEGIRPGVWMFDGHSPTAQRQGPPPTTAEIETCAPCHSRRIEIHEGHVPGQPLLDTHEVSLLADGLYHPDGQILAEVYVYGSFIQSKMHRQGVQCTDCHDPHSLDLRAQGNALCLRCHSPATFNVESHHHHPPGSPGAECVNCHMPVRTYMVVDPRRDHSLRVPRPDLSVVLGTPNACNQCHDDQTAQWAADAVARWYGPDRRREPHYGEAIAAWRAGAPGAAEQLAALAAGGEAPAIARATALSLLGRSPAPATASIVAAVAGDPDPMVRAAAIEALDSADATVRVRLTGPMLSDPVRAVRLAAARVLAPASASLTSAALTAAFDAAATEVVESELTNADRPESHVNIGNFLARLGRYAEAESSFRRAMAIDPRWVPAYVNLADLYRALGRDREAEPLLIEAVRINPDLAAAHYALGLLLVRAKRYPEAIESLKRAARLDPGNSRFSYVYAVALGSVGRDAESLAELQNAHQRSPADPDILMALIDLHRRRGELDSALSLARELAALYPQDESVRQLIQQLDAGGG